MNDLVRVDKESGNRRLFGFIPDCIILIKNLMADSRVSLQPKLVLIGVVIYLVFPLDIIPDLIPLAGQLDDIALVVYSLRNILRAAGVQVLRENWRGTDASLQMLIRTMRVK